VLHSWVVAYALPKNIRRGWKRLPMIKALTYCEITEEKKLLTLGTERFIGTITLRIMTFSITTLNIMTFSISKLIVSIKINKTPQSA
jgi:hypothetical protein